MKILSHGVPAFFTPIATQSLSVTYQLLITGSLTHSMSYSSIVILTLPPSYPSSLPPLSSNTLHTLTFIHGDVHCCRHDKRVLYCRSESLRDKWVSSLQHAAHVVPIEASTHPIITHHTLCYHIIPLFHSLLHSTMVYDLLKASTIS